MFIGCAGPLAAEPLPPGFVDAAAAVPGLRTEMRYAGAQNFTGARVDGYEAGRCLLTRPAAEALGKAQTRLAEAGLGLKVFDCYRPARASAHFLAWSRVPGQEAGKAAYFPRIQKADLFARGYIGSRSAHSRGSTVDLTLVRLESGAELPMGTPFDFFGPASGRAGPGIGRDETANRERLRAVMIAVGFTPYDREWWHFTLAREPYPASYFDVPITEAAEPTGTAAPSGR